MRLTDTSIHSLLPVREAGDRGEPVTDSPPCAKDWAERLTPASDVVCGESQMWKW